MQTFNTILHQEGDSAFGLEFPDLPGCFAASDTREGIGAAADEAIRLWFDDTPGGVPAFRVTVTPAAV